MTRRRYPTLGTMLTMALGSAIVAIPGACVKPRCYEDADCSRPDICLIDGQCGSECRTAGDCGARFDCVSSRCVPTISAIALTCAEDMVAVGSAFCIDRYEASRPNATSTSAGTDNSVARSQVSVIPWQVSDNAAARTACQAAGKDLCTPQQWKSACEGSTRTTYGYGDDYEPETCNGIDLFGRSNFHLLPTGSLPECHSDWGVVDINGNLWEHVLDGSDASVRGGAYNCSDSRTLHRCDYVPGNWAPSARGFRCCLVPDENSSRTAPEVGEAGVAGSSGGCLEAVSPGVRGTAGPASGGAGSRGVGLVGVLFGGGDAVSQTSGGSSVSAVEGGSGSGGSEASGGFAGGTDSGGTQLGGVVSGGTDSGVPGSGGTATGGASLGGAESAGTTAGSAGTTDGASDECPADMVASGGSCVDRWEASHADATASTQGSSLVAASQTGVLPWFPVTVDQARTACSAAGKRLCRLDEWSEGCQGPNGFVYSYGNQYDPALCNGIDTFCNCSTGSSCAAAAQCPYPHCWYQSDSSGIGPCGASFHVMPTGSFPRCVSHAGAFDINGNVWELVDTTDGLEHFRGGAYNCSDSEALHRCDHDGTWGPSARGFRCCRDRS